MSEKEDKKKWGWGFYSTCLSILITAGGIALTYNYNERIQTAEEKAILNQLVLFVSDSFIRKQEVNIKEIIVMIDILTKQHNLDNPPDVETIIGTLATIIHLDPLLEFDKKQEYLNRMLKLDADWKILKASSPKEPPLKNDADTFITYSVQFFQMLAIFTVALALRVAIKESSESIIKIRQSKEELETQMEWVVAREEARADYEKDLMAIQFGLDNNGQAQIIKKKKKLNPPFNRTKAYPISRGGHSSCRRSNGSDTWHFCINCTFWPTSDYKSSIRKPTSGELCNQCMAKQNAGNCK